VLDRWGKSAAKPDGALAPKVMAHRGLAGSEVMTATTKMRKGQLTNFTKVADAMGDVGVRAELLATVNAL